jgi:hypothetical protein
MDRNPHLYRYEQPGNMDQSLAFLQKTAEIGEIKQKKRNAVEFSSAALRNRERVGVTATYRVTANGTQRPYARGKGPISKANGTRRPYCARFVQKARPNRHIRSLSSVENAKTPMVAK